MTRLVPAVLLSLLVLSTWAFAQTAAPLPGVESAADQPLAWALWLYKKAQAGEWRMVLAGGLMLLVGALRWAMGQFKAELEERAWYRNVALPLSPMVLATLAACGTDLLAGKDLGMSIYRGLNVGLMAMGAYTGWKKTVAPALGAVWSRVRARPQETTATPPEVASPKPPEVG